MASLGVQGAPATSLRFSAGGAAVVTLLSAGRDRFGFHFMKLSLSEIEKVQTKTERKQNELR